MSVTRIRSISLLIFFLMSCCLPVGAQNNPYKINDSLYPIFQRATKNRYNKKGLLIADTLYNQAVKKHDKKAQCIALTIPVSHYFHTGEQDKLIDAIEKIKQVSRKNGYLQYYYFGCIHLVNHFLNSQNSLRALQEANIIREQAFKDNYPYGISTCLRSLGNIYIARRNWKLALKHYQEALDYTRQYMPEQDLALLYWNIANCYMKSGKLDTALENAETGIKVAKTNVNKIACMLVKAHFLYKLKRYDEFENMYKECLQMVNRYGNVKHNALAEMKLFHHLLHHRYKEAHALVDSVNNPEDKAMYRRRIFTEEGKYKEAYEMYQQQQALKDSVLQQVQSSDVAEINARLGNERLKQESQALQLQNAELNLQNTTLALNQAEAKANMERINAENSRLLLNNRNLELSELKSTSERQQHQIREQQLHAHNRQSMLMMGLALLFLLIIGLVIYLYLRHKAISVLKDKNKELVVAREQAEQSNRMKTLFIQNMSHEIRTPLNAVVGFSQILAESGLRLSEKDKEDFSNRIQQNSELLTTLINDILDLSSLESGKYDLQLQRWSCNELCRISLDTVTHRKPQGVNLYFTTEVADDFMITTDGKRLQQVLINFLTNAEKNTEKGEIHLHCSLSERPGMVTFSVSDTGPGIPPDKTDTIFERFKKLDSFKPGTGLGLNICRIIAERLQGDVLLDKSYTSGARFLLVLPIEEEEEEA